MPDIVIQNLTTEDVHLGDFYTKVPKPEDRGPCEPNEPGTVTSFKTSVELMHSVSLHKAINEGKVALAITFTDDELGSDFCIFPGIKAGGTNLTVKDEGTDLTTTASSLDFVGPGVVATAVGNDVTVTIAGGGGSTTCGWIYITDITAQGGGTTSNKTYQDSNNTVLQTVTASTTDLTVDVRASYPLVTVDGNAATLTRHADESHYSGTVDITVAGTGDIQAVLTDPDDATGCLDTVTVTVEAPPNILTLSFTGGYPGSQTELKQGDTFQITGTTDRPADAIQFLNQDAYESLLVTFASSTSFTVTGTIADRGTTLQALPGVVQARDAVTAALGPSRATNQGGGTTDGVDLVNLNNLFPSHTFGAKTYPGGQSALKNSETADVVVTNSNFDTITYDSPNSQLSITAPASGVSPKTVQRIAGDYNVSTNNLRATLNRAANDATLVDQTVVNIAHVAAVIVVTEATTRLQTGESPGEDHEITLTSDQQLLSTPTLDEDAGGGVFQGSWTGGPTVYTRDLRVIDGTTTAVYDWQNLSATNLAGIVTTTIDTSGANDDTYEIGGFTSRTVTWTTPFDQNISVSVTVSDYTKLQAGIFTATAIQSTRNATQGNTDDLTNTYTVTAVGAFPTTFFWNDLNASNSNSSGTAALLEVEEVP